MKSGSKQIAIATLIALLLLTGASGTAISVQDPGMIGPTQTQNVSTPNRTIWISSHDPGQNYPGDSGMWVGYGPNVRAPSCCDSTRALIRFGLAGVPASATISNVALQATIADWHGSGAFTYNIAQITEAWSEDSVNWNNQPDREGPIASLQISGTSGVVTWSSSDLRDLVRGWVDETIVNRGIYIRRAGDTTDSTPHDRLFEDVQLIITFQDTAQPDLIISHMEITQAVQDWDNGVPLVQGKRTVVRVSVSACCQATDIHDVAVSLEAQWPLETSIGKIGPTQPSGNSMSIPGMPVAPRTLRGDETRTFNFLVPTAWINQDEVWLIAKVNGRRAVTESDYENNTRQHKITLHQRPSLHVVGVNVWGTTELGDTYDPWPRDEFDDHFLPHLNWMKRVYPVPGIRLWQLPGFDRLEYDPDRRSTGVLDDLADRQSILGSASNSFARELASIQWYGLDSWSGFEPEICIALGCKWYGVSTMNGLQATGMDTPADKGIGEIMAHELAHGGPFGRLHASDKCTNWPDSDEGNFCDINYPLADGCIDEYGFDTVEMKAIAPDDPDSLFGATCRQDIMSYGHFAWISKYTYEALYEAAADLIEPSRMAGTGQRSESIRPVLVASGLIAMNNQARLRPFYLVRTAAPVDPTPGVGNYSLALEDAAGHILALRRFDIRWNVGPVQEPNPVGRFGVHLLWNPAATRVVLRKGAQVLKVRPISDHAPQVTVLNPTGGETWTGQQEVRWQASDADGDTLIYLVQLSDDGGAAWQTVGMNIWEKSYLLDADMLPGTNQAMIRVVASDGVRSNHGESGMFTIPNKSPEVKIITPPRPRVYGNPYSIDLSARAYDMEDGPLGGVRVVWTSDKDGVLGRGEDLVVAQLSEGRHRITVVATDQDGNHSDDAVIVFVLDEPAQRLFLPSIHGGG